MLRLSGKENGRKDVVSMTKEIGKKPLLTIKREILRIPNKVRKFGEFNTHRTYQRQRKQKIVNDLLKFVQIDGGTSTTKRKRNQSIAKSNKNRKLWRALFLMSLKDIAYRG